MGTAALVTAGAVISNINAGRFLLLGTAVILTSGMLLVLAHRGQTRLAGTLMVAAFWLIATGAMYTGGGVRASMIMAYIVIIFVTGLLKGGRAGAVVTALCTLSGLGLAVLEMHGRLPPSAIEHTPLSFWLTATFFFWVVAVMQYLSVGAIRQALRRAQAELDERRQAEDAYRAVVENSLQGLVIIQNGQFVFVNRAAATFLGYPVDEVLALSRAQVVDLLYPDDRDTVIRQIRARLRGEPGPVISEFRCLRHDGSVRWVESYASIIRYRGRRALQVAYLDVTDRKQAEVALRESERLYRQAIEAADAVPYYEDYTRNAYTFMGEGILALSGYRPDEITPNVWASIVEEHNLFGEASRYRSVAEAAQAARRGEFKVWKADSLLTARDGQKRWVLDSAVEVTDSNGVVVGSIGILQDVTARKEVELALSQRADEIGKLYRASARLLAAGPDLRDLAQSIADTVIEEFGLPECGLWLIRGDGRALTRLAYSGYAPDYVAFDIPLDGPGLLTAAIGSGQPIYAPDVRLDTRYLAGDAHTLSELVAPLQVAGRVIGAINMESPTLNAFSDRDQLVLITFAERAALAIENARLLASLEQAVQRAHRLTTEAEEASQIKSQFLMNTSHELRTPLTSIIGALDIVANDLCASRYEELTLMQTAAEAAQNLVVIVDDLLEIAKIEAGRTELQTQITALGPLLDEVYAQFAPQAEKKSIRLALDAPDLSTLLQADPDKLRRILFNLVGNAIKFTDHGGVTVRVRADSGSRQLIIEVADTGIGVPPDVQTKLFQPFVQADGSPTRRFGGNGLGLSIARRLAEMMDGRLSLYSAGLGQGTTLRLRLPIADEGG